MEPSAPALYVESRGEGCPLVLAHGFGGSARNWRPQQRALSDRVRVVSFDQRGHARSEAPRDPSLYSLAHLAQDFGRVLDAEGISKAVVGGLSLGAAAALEFALRAPERVEALVLAALPGPGGFARVAPDFALAIEQDGLEAAGDQFVWGPRSGLDATGANLVRQGFLEHPPHALAALLRGAICELAQPRASDPRTARITAPVLLIAGAGDAPALEANAALARAVPHARTATLPDAGHVVNLAAPTAFNAQVLRFLEGLRDQDDSIEAR